MHCGKTSEEITIVYSQNEGAITIVTIANPKGGTGKTTLVRALSGTAAHAGNDVFLIDADSRANTASRHESGESVRLLRTYPELRLV